MWCLSTSEPVVYQAATPSRRCMTREGVHSVCAQWLWLCPVNPAPLARVPCWDAVLGCVNRVGGRCGRRACPWHMGIMDLRPGNLCWNVPAAPMARRATNTSVCALQAPVDTPAITITLTEASALSQTCGQAFLNAMTALPPASDVKPRLGTLAPAPAPVPRTAPLSIAGAPPTDARASMAVKRRRAAVDEDWDEPAHQQDDDSSGPEGADGTKPCKCAPLGTCHMHVDHVSYARTSSGTYRVRSPITDRRSRQHAC